MNMALKVLILVLAVIGVIALIGVLSMWMMHAGMMGGRMM